MSNRVSIISKKVPLILLLITENYEGNTCLGFESFGINHSFLHHTRRLIYRFGRMLSFMNRSTITCDYARQMIPVYLT